jgi:hypothetical protein
MQLTILMNSHLNLYSGEDYLELRIASGSHVFAGSRQNAESL